MLIPLDRRAAYALSVIRHDNLYAMVAQSFADLPEDQRLPELVRLIDAIQRRVDLQPHLDCLFEAIRELN